MIIVVINPSHVGYRRYEMVEVVEKIEVVWKHHEMKMLRKYYRNIIT